MSKHAQVTASRARTLLGTGALVVATALVITLLVVLGGGDGKARDVTGTDTSDPDTAAQGPVVDPSADPEAPDVGNPGAVVREAEGRAKSWISPKLAARVEKASRRQPDPPTTFTVTSFNVLGASHTNGRGRRAHFANGVTRMGYSVNIMRENGVEVGGMQEFERPQIGVLRARMPHFAVYPGTSMRVIDGANSLIWDTTKWTALETHTIPIPYFGGRPVYMPYVLLQNIATKQKVWFANFHNPADVKGPAGRWRSIAVARQADLANRLGADGTPVVMTGDFNAREDFYCPYTARATNMKSADGGGVGSPCRTPARMNVDWIVGSSEFEMTFKKLDGGFIERVTDHPIIFSTLTFTPTLD